MTTTSLYNYCLVVLTFTLLTSQAFSAITKRQTVIDMRGNIVNNNDAKYPSSECCVIPTCQNPNKCYQTLSCGYMCKSGKYPPAENNRTPGYQLKEGYWQYSCRFGDCKNYFLSCTHCQDPREYAFSVNLVRKDCKECYYLE